MTEVPRYTHDCTRCRFLGRFDYDGPLSTGETEACKADLYYCISELFGGSVLARHSDRGPDYASMPLSILIRDEVWMRDQPSTHGPGLLEALDRYRKENK